MAGLLAVAVATFLGAAGAASVRAHAAPAGFTARKVPGYGITVALPSSWVGSAAPEGTAALGVKYVYRDPNATSGFTTNLNLIVTPLPPGLTLRQWFFSGVSAAYQYIGTTTNTTIGGVRGLHYVSTKATRLGTVPLLTDEYAVVRNGDVFLFTYTSLASARSHYLPVFGASAASIRFLA